jgi:hypothetical protein
MTEALEDPFAIAVNEEDPFATAEDLKSGASWTPSPKLEDIDGRLIVMVPRSLDKEAKTPDEWVAKGQPPTRELYTVDLIVLSGGPFSFEYKEKNKDGKGNVTVTEKVWEVTELPAMFTRYWVPQGSLIGQLKKAAASERPILCGYLRKGPQAKDRGAKNFDTIAAEFEKWKKNPRGGMPDFSWQVDLNITPADVAARLAWWKKAHANGFTL